MACTPAEGGSVAAISQKDCKCDNNSCPPQILPERGLGRPMVVYIIYTNMYRPYRSFVSDGVSSTDEWRALLARACRQRPPPKDCRREILQPSCPIALNLILVSFLSLYLICGDGLQI
jgi:hypothetical protein